MQRRRLEGINTNSESSSRRRRIRFATLRVVSGFLPPTPLLLIPGNRIPAAHSVARGSGAMESDHSRARLRAPRRSLPCGGACLPSGSSRCASSSERVLSGCMPAICSMECHADRAAPRLASPGDLFRPFFTPCHGLLRIR
jgi:hypothetical protein